MINILIITSIVFFMNKAFENGAINNLSYEYFLLQKVKSLYGKMLTPHKRVTLIPTEIQKYNVVK